MVARPVRLRPGARTPTQPLEGTITMSAIAERVAVAAETGEAVTSADVTRSAGTGPGRQAGSPRLRSAGGHVFLPLLECDATVRESTLNLLERNGVPASR